MDWKLVSWAIQYSFLVKDSLLRYYFLKHTASCESGFGCHYTNKNDSCLEGKLYAMLAIYNQTKLHTIARRFHSIIWSTMVWDHRVNVLKFLEKCT